MRSSPGSADGGVKSEAEQVAGAGLRNAEGEATRSAHREGRDDGRVEQVGTYGIRGVALVCVRKDADKDIQDDGIKSVMDDEGARNA